MPMFHGQGVEAEMGADVGGLERTALPGLRDCLCKPMQNPLLGQQMEEDSDSVPP